MIISPTAPTLKARTHVNVKMVTKETDKSALRVRLHTIFIYGHLIQSNGQLEFYRGTFPF